MTLWHSIVVLMMATGCGSQADAAADTTYSSLQRLDTARVRIVGARDTVTVVVELAETSEAQTMGLMERARLAPNAGMLFLYPTMQSAESGFWMFRTHIPLDIAFADSVGVIRSIQTMTPCESTLAGACPTYPPGARYQAALEVNAGYFASKGIQIGHRLVLQDTLGRRPTPR